MTTRTPNPNEDIPARSPGRSYRELLDDEVNRVPDCLRENTKVMVLANYHGVRIRHFHQTIDKYINGEQTA